MRGLPWRGALVVLLVGAGWLALGPWFLLALGLPFAHWRVRDRFGAHWPDWRARRTWRRVGGTVAALALTTGLVVLVPDGWLPLPTGGGLAVTDRYQGRPAAARPITGVERPRHPGTAPDGRGPAQAFPGPGPLGNEPEVETAWYGVEACATLALDSHDRLVGLCESPSGPALHVIDPDTLHKLATARLPEQPQGDAPSRGDACGRASLHLDGRDRAVTVTADHRILAFTTADATGEPDLTVDDSWDLADAIPAGDCPVALVPDRHGRIWFATRNGLVGTVSPHSGTVRTRDLGEGIVSSFPVDEQAAYVVSDTALYRLEAGREGRPTVAWRTAYDRGSVRKPGLLSRGSGTAPILLDDGLVAIVDNADPRTQVLVVERATGEVRCTAPVFDKFESGTASALVSLGDAVVVENNYGYSSPVSTMLGRAPVGGFARVDVDGCRVRWTNQVVAPTSVPKASLRTGLLYAYTAERSWWGVTAWYLTGIDVRTGRRAFSVRTGTGTLANDHHAAVTLGPDGTAYVATLGGLVKVRDRG